MVFTKQPITYLKTAHNCRRQKPFLTEDVQPAFIHARNPVPFFYFNKAVMIKSIHILCCVIVAGIVFGTADHGFSSDRISVVFSHKDNRHTVLGRKIDSHTWIFNEGAKKRVRVTTLNWPPYIGQDICRQGWVQQFTIALLSSQGYEIVSTFFPWARSVGMAESGKADILYPEYYIEPSAPSDVFKGKKRSDHLAISKPIPGGPIAFMKRKGDRNYFRGSLQLLKNEKIGVVRGYQNTPEFDRLMDRGFFNIDLASDDLSNAKKLVAGRVNLIIGDPAAIRYSIFVSKALNPVEKCRLLSGIETVKPIIQYNPLYYAISKKTPHWEDLLKVINTAISTYEESGELTRIINDTNSECSFMME